MSSRIRVRLALICVLVLPPIAPSASAGSCESRGQPYETERATVHALAACYAARSADEDREYFAAIFRMPDGFVFAVGVGGQHQDLVTLRFDRLEGETLVALWHTHGAGGVHRNLFSPTDTALVRQVGVPFYLTDPTGRLRVFRPGDRPRAPLNRTSARPPVGSAMGSVLVANID